jgi:uncharacterized protein
VIRSIISEINRLESGPTPIKTDLQLLNMLNKRKEASHTAAKQFAEAQREDLKEKEEAQISVLDEYAASVQVMSKEEMVSVVRDVVGEMGEDGKRQPLVMKQLLQPGGTLEGKPVDKKELAKAVQEVLASV